MVLAFLDMVFALIGFVIVLIVTILAAEVIASPFARPRGDKGAKPPKTCVIIPAHDEGANLIPTLKDIEAARFAELDVLVIADNCSDDTAEIAMRHGAQVIERCDPQRRGKGYALAYGIDYLRSSPPECVIFLDADSRFAPQAIAALAAQSAASSRPIQAMYEMRSSSDAETAKDRISRFAWGFINIVRMRGLSVIGGVTRFTGVGLAIDWEAISNLDFASGAITEDHELTFLLAEKKRAPLLEPGVTVWSVLAESDDGRVTQRARWEHGSLGVLFKRAPVALLQSITRRNTQLFFVAVDAFIPPIVLLGAIVALYALCACVLTIFAGLQSAFWAILSIFIIIVAILVGWLVYGRRFLTLRDVAALFPYLLEKLSIYGAAGRRSALKWTRTDRTRKR